MKRTLRLIPVLLILAGLALLLYPRVSQGIYALQAGQVIADYEARLRGMEEDALEALYQQALSYNRQLYEEKQKHLTDPFSYEQVGFSLERFGLAEDMIGQLSIPKMKIRLPIYLGASKENMNEGAAHLSQTSLPVGGENSNAVLAAHRGMGSAAMFRDIEALAPGDEVIISNFRETLRYRVWEIKIIRPSDINEILIQEGQDLVTLLTCHPYRHNYQRYVVYCRRVT